MGYTELDEECIKTIRLIAIEAVQKANSGHPGAPMGLAPCAHVLFTKFINITPPTETGWLNRDRFVLSNGHACMLQYAMLHLLGFGITTTDLGEFRQLGSKLPGHPEASKELGIEVTTGPLGQGFANAVGLAIAQEHTAANFNKPDFELIDNYTYVIIGDGCAQEGVASEAASLAGHLQLGRLICIYDDNHISIDGDTNLAFTEDVLKRFEAYGWHTQHVEKGNTDLDAIESAIRAARDVKDQPSIIKLTTTIGYGSKKANTHTAHGAPLGVDEVARIKEKYGFKEKYGPEGESKFFVPPEVKALYMRRVEASKAKEKQWSQLFANYASSFKPEHEKLTRIHQHRKLPEGWERELPTYEPSDKAMATRSTSERVLEKIQAVIPELVSGSADLTGSNNTWWKGVDDFQSPSLLDNRSKVEQPDEDKQQPVKAKQLGNRHGRYFRYGVREHAMAAIMNGMAAYGTIIPAGGTFLNFVSYAAGAVRLSALSEHRVIYVATHDSIGLGEDGPTHQPIETLAHFRALPNIMVWRPADGNETSAAYYVALTKNKTPSILALTRQVLPQLEESTIAKATKGGYYVREEPDAKIILISTGSEVCICLEAAEVLRGQNIRASVVSLPCCEVFIEQGEAYCKSILRHGIPVLSVEALSTLGWERYSHEQFGLNSFGFSGKYKDIYNKLEFTAKGIAQRAESTIKFWKDVKPLYSPIERALSRFPKKDEAKSEQDKPTT